MLTEIVFLWEPIEKTYDRRTLLQSGTVGAVALLAGCLGADEPGEETYYVVAYHWGFAAFDEDGVEHDPIDVPEGTEVTLVAVNDHATDAFEALPDPVEAELEEFDALARTQQHVEDGIIPEPDDTTIEEEYEEAHDHAHDGHGHDDDGHGHDEAHDNGDADGDDDHNDDDHNDNGDELTMLDHEVIVPAYDVELEVLSTADEPVEASFVADEPGTSEIICTHDCGYGHPYMSHELLRVE